MKVAVLGLGFVGLVTSAVLANENNNVIGVDIDKEKIDTLQKGDSYIYEPGLKELLNQNKDKLSFSTMYSSIKNPDFVFICVPTPNIKGEINLSYVDSAVKELQAIGIKENIVIKSTVVPGTARKLSQKYNVKILSNPEFLREGNAIYDTTHPDRIVIGGDTKQAENLSILWGFTKAQVIKTTNENAELIKYASNSFLATKISFINEIANLCETIPGCDVNIVAHGMGLDHRIGKEFLRAGIGFGGSCFPKDTKAIESFAKMHNVTLGIVKSAIKVNDERAEKAVSFVEKWVGKLDGRVIAVFGITFKENTNDLRESKALEVVNLLVKRGAKIRVYDPVIKSYEGLNLCESPEECAENADAIIIASEWDMFRDMDLYDKGALVIDLKRIVDLEKHPKVKAIGVGYES
ncbi:MAG: UDP-glucose dehydrogenase family protein [Thermoplasmata archaeon]